MNRICGRLTPAVVNCLSAIAFLGTSLFAADVAANSSESSIVAQLNRVEYEFSELDVGVWTAPNRAQEIRVSVSAEGLRLTPRDARDSSWELLLSLEGLGRGPSLEDVGGPYPGSLAIGDRVEVQRHGITEWYVNMTQGLEQGFTVPRSPAGDGDLVLELAIDGTVTAAATADGQELLFRSASGDAALRYGALAVFDAVGRKLPSRFELEGRRLRIVTDDSQARYPVVVDPLVTNPDWSSESNQTLASFGVEISIGGDLNGDGFDDVVVGADDFDNGQAEEGMVFVFLGSAGGPSPSADWTIESDHELARFGRSVDASGDVNGDGYDDLIIGSPAYDDDDGSLVELDEGWAFVFYGSMLGLSGGPASLALDADWSGQSNQVEADYGRRVRFAGDVDGDGYDDIIVGASEYTNGQAFEGAVFGYYGSNAGLGPLGTTQNADWTTEGDQVNSLYGFAIGAAGDVNADGYDDVIIGAPNYENNFEDEGAVSLFLGSDSGLQTTPVWFLEGGQNSVRLGVAVSSAGDVNGDGYDDVLIGADIYSDGQTSEGAAFVFAGSQTAALGEIPAWTGQVNQGAAFVGFSVASAGDINNDGFDEVIVGAVGFDNGELDEGAAFLYLGSTVGLPDEPSRQFEINQEAANFGASVDGAGDVNGDGYDDVIVGAVDFTNLEVFEGGAFLYYGCPDPELDGVCQSIDNCPELVNPEQQDADLDGIGDACDPCQDVDVDGVCDQPRVLVEWAGPGEQVLVEQGSLMRYLANDPATDPGITLEWTELDFPAAQSAPWSLGIYGTGFEISPTGGADDLIDTPVPAGTISLFTRSEFILNDVESVFTLFLGAEWDDAYVAWINGVEVFRSAEMPAGVPLWNTPPADSHESSNGTTPNYVPLNDISFSGIPALRNGQNVLAIGAWNISAGSTDLVLVPRLSINRPRETGMHSLANSGDPVLGLSYTTLAFDEIGAGWSPGNYGSGFDTSGAADSLINTEIPTDTVSVFSRARFLLDRDTVDNMFLGVDYDDGYVAWINGTEVARSSNMPGAPGTDPGWNASPSPPHESSNGAQPDYGTLLDITSTADPVLINGENVFTIGAWNNSADTDDLVVVPRLSINEGNVDNCIGDFNPGQEDLDGDDVGDACDTDIDGDGVLNGEDNCPMLSNAPSDCDANAGTPDEQCDLDVDGQGDVCDVCPDDATNDGDLDGICGGTGFAAPKIGDGDNCPAVSNPPSDCDGNSGTPDEQCDLDADGQGDACDTDVDGDTIDNDLDNCPVEANTDQNDADFDDVGDVCDCQADNDQAWETPGAVDSVLMAKTDMCGNFACSQSSGTCVDNTDCVSDTCDGLTCSISGAGCTADGDCEVDTCDNFTCSAGGNSCLSEVDCTADFCAGRLCSEGGNGCTGNADCTADTCDNKTCLVGGNSCFSHFDCFEGPGDLCIGACTFGGLCADDDACNADVCGDGTCAVGSEACSDDSVCTADVCEGSCTVGGNTCTVDGQCTAPQADLCEGTCSLGFNTCGDDVDCVVPQTDLCQGSCTIGGNSCSSGAACVAPSIDTLFWQAPSLLGGTAVVFDTLRSPSSTDFLGAGTCLDPDGQDRITSDATDPASGDLQYYLIRVENDCPTGNMGSGALGVRSGVVCE